MELPESVRALDGVEVEIRGLVLQLDESKFLLLKVLLNPHSGPELPEAIVVTLPPARHRFSTCQVVVRGVLSVGEELIDPEGHPTSLYRMTATRMWVDDAHPDQPDHCASLEAYQRE